MISLGRYLKSNFGVVSGKRGQPPVVPFKDVRDKIQTDFKTTEYL